MEKQKANGNLEATHQGCTHQGCTNETKAAKSSGIAVTHEGCTHTGCMNETPKAMDSYGRPALRQSNGSGLVALLR